MACTIAIVILARSFLVAGRLQDKFGSLPVSLTEGLLIGLGSIPGVASRHDDSLMPGLWVMIPGGQSDRNNSLRGDRPRLQGRLLS